MKLWRKWSLLWSKMFKNAKNGCIRGSQLVLKKTLLRKIKNRNRRHRCQSSKMCRARCRAHRSRKKSLNRYSKSENPRSLRTKNTLTTLYLKIKLLSPLSEIWQFKIMSLIIWTFKKTKAMVPRVKISKEFSKVLHYQVRKSFKNHAPS